MMVLSANFQQYFSYILAVSFIADTPVPSTNKADRHDITEILLKGALNTIAISPFNIQ
jgi:hypothetical protein